MKIGHIAIGIVLALLTSPSALSGRDLDAAVGRALFERIWTIAGASNRASDGLGPLFNARSCSSCHAGGGAGRLPGADGDPNSAGMVLRLPRETVYGQQLQTNAAPGHAVEGRLTVTWRTERRRLKDGTEVALRAPVAQAEGGFGPLPDQGSLRLAPDLAGLGQVEAALDGTGRSAFGLKGTHESLSGQVEEALLLDLGLSTGARPDPWGDCTEQETACRAALHGVGPTEGGAELSDEVVRSLVAFVRALPAPEPMRPDDPGGAALFALTGCASCHRPRLGALAAHSDFVAHDLGESLADGDPADPRRASWRTAPLWGLGRKLANGAPLLHDGRARNELEAILWHGGEADEAVDRFQHLPAAERDRLLDYLKGL